MDDAQLVVAALAEDRDAYAAIYDRYADRIHDFCASILRNRADASDALQETFHVAFEVLDQLTEPGRLRSWLYAVAHRAVLDRLARPGSSLGPDVSDVSWGSASADERLSRAELAEFVWQASSGLSERDRVLLDLHFRQGLEGRDLAGAAGVAAPSLDSRQQRLKDQVGRSLGALLVARTGRRSCPDLSAILDGWDGRLTPEFRDAVTAHVDDCEGCNSRRRIVPSPLALLAATPLAPAPAYLRGVVLGRAELEALEREGDSAPGRLRASTGWAFNRDGFPDLGTSERRRPDLATGPVYASTRPTAALPVVPPGSRGAAGPWGPGAAPSGAAFSGAAGRATPVRATAPTTYLPTVEPPRPPKDHDRWPMLVGGVAGLVILIAAAVIVLSNRSPSTSGTLGVSSTTATTTTSTSNTTPLTASPVVIPSTAIPATTAVANGHLIVGGRKTVDLGTTTSTLSLTVGNDGQAPLNFNAFASGSGLTVNPVAGTLNSGASQALTVTLDRTAAPQGPFTGSIQITSPGGNATIAFTALVDAGPLIVGEMVTPFSVITKKCAKVPPPLSSTTSTVTAAVTGTEPVKEVVLHWQGPGSDGSGTVIMTMTVGGSYSGMLPAYAVAGTVSWWVTAIDNANATGLSQTHPLQVVTC